MPSAYTNCCLLLGEMILTQKLSVVNVSHGERIYEINTTFCGLII